MLLEATDYRLSWPSLQTRLVSDRILTLTPGHNFTYAESMEITVNFA